jgi:hypothetical protein
MKKPEKLKKGFKATHYDVTGQMLEEMQKPKNRKNRKTAKHNDVKTERHNNRKAVKQKDGKAAKKKDSKVEKLKVTLYIDRRADIILEGLKYQFKIEGVFRSKSEIVERLIMEHEKDIKI